MSVMFNNTLLFNHVYPVEGVMVMSCVSFLEKKERLWFLLSPYAYTRINSRCHASTQSGRFTNSNTQASYEVAQMS